MNALSPKADVESSAARPWLAIVGVGEDGRAGLSPAALRALETATLVVGGARHLALVAPIAAPTLAWPSPIADGYGAILARRGEAVCVLATGDPFNHGVGAELARLIPADEIVCHPGPSAFTLAAARMGWSLPECACVSLHGRALERIIPLLQPGARLLALSWDGTTPARLAALLDERGMGGSKLTVLEAMGGPRERVRTADAAGFALGDVDPLNTIALQVEAPLTARVVTLAPGLDDAWFANDGQLTKSEMRAMTLAALAPRAGELLWDVGAGAGSVAIEWCLSHPRNRCLAIEERAERAERARGNALQLGAVGVEVRVGQAPGALADLPPPDAVFIGGGAHEAGVFEACWGALKPGGRLVINAVTLETEARLAALHGAYGGLMRRIALSRLERVGSMHGWRAAMPVTQWLVTKP
ncbi:precorrin-6y C5,15-methyltransferase (decarboxylating) subunit CbiE [Salinarimonas soli]|uniref:Precorrin-6y C5,15-methyltransferase (Decarboxylating) subunit CbiE n=1 Tax=Salinarimonas soli TaxID=1638099 RepID=A0A5B2VVF7_9HYPH|nr:precorrin-6y C5,15-methyltransferase (decarboxylating) subunit CbiE [Salinarimonas soli]KAA2242312.1 precorrin-6y C5,15-methyltransferase (decarboxylating) subunit CbiE [Salinarimonas soli]